eukprot:6538803-Alexandrium_andersonii.AAC.1
MSAGWGPVTARLVAGQVASLAELARALPPAHIGARAVDLGRAQHACRLTHGRSAHVQVRALLQA